MSSAVFKRVAAIYLAIFTGWGLSAQARHSNTAAGPTTSSLQTADPQQLFEQGEAALKSGDLDKAEHDFRAVIALNPQVAGAYANLGVVYMRRKNWPQALAMLRKAEHLAPKVSGIRLNIGLVYYRQNDFAKAIPPFESVLHDAPDSYQVRYLLGLCYFFNERYAETVSTLEPLWEQASSQLNYLYVVGIAANKANRPEARPRPGSHAGTAMGIFFLIDFDRLILRR